MHASNAPGLIPAMPGVEERIAERRSMARKNEYHIVGKMMAVVFDRATMPRAEVFQQNMLWWEGEQPDAFPWLGISTDEQELLIISPVPHPPDIRDVSNMILTDGVYRAAKHPQRYRDRTRAKLKNSDFLIIQPVIQVLYKCFGEAAMAMIKPSTGFDGTHMAFLIDPNTGEGHFIGGRFEIDRRIRQAAPSEAWQRGRQGVSL